MGQPKPLLPWLGATLVERQIEALLEAGVDDVYVVTGHRAYEVQSKVKGPRVHRVLNPHYRQGKSTSVKAGLASLPDGTSAIVLLAVDQPRPSWLIRKVLESHVARKALISCPRYRGHGGHPLVFDGSLAVELDTISEETQGVRSVVKAHASDVNWVEVDTAVARLDLNTPEAYQEARKTFQGAGPE
jgi:CTP:molybdopterin cytidylyltransferase MocA